MQGVILAAGRGTRMKELTKEIPKPLLIVDGKTILGHNFAALPDDVDEVVLVVGYLGEKIREFIGTSFAGKKVVYAEQKELQGTAHALFLCQLFLKDKFLVLMGDDIYSKPDLEMLSRQPSPAILAWELQQDDTLRDRQAIMKLDEFGDLENVVERQPAVKGALVNTGAYLLDKRVFSYPLVSAGFPAEEYGLPQTFMQMVKDGVKMKVVKATHWKKVVAPEDLK